MDDECIIDLCVHTRGELEDLGPFLHYPDVLQYLTFCLSPINIDLLDFDLLPLDDIKHATLEAVPGREICEYGYLTIGMDIGGNIICIHVPTGSVWHVEHEFFSGEDIKINIRNIAGFLSDDDEILWLKKHNAMVKISDDLEEFLVGYYKKEFDICQYLDCP